MDFDLTDEQRMLQDSLTAWLLAERCGFEQRLASRDEPAGYSRALWSRYAEMGLLGLPFAEGDGGLGGGPVETLIVMQALGRALALEPYLQTVVLCGALLREAGSARQRDAQVGAIVAGERMLAFAGTEAQSGYDLGDVTTRAERDGEGWRLSGTKRFVLAGDSADLMIVSARTRGDARERDGVSLFLVDPAAAGVTRRGYRTQDHQRAADIRFRCGACASRHLLGAEGAALPLIEHAVESATAALCAEAVGAMERVHEITVEYLKMRKQFGVAIGTFQALQHRAVDMLVAVEQARSMAFYAAMMCSEPDATERSRAISAAKVQINKSGALRRAGGDPAARRHRHDRGMPGRALLPAAVGDRDAVRRHRTPSAACGGRRRNG